MDVIVKFIVNNIGYIEELNHSLITPQLNRGGVIFSLQFFCVSVCVCVCVSVSTALLVNNIPAKRMNRFGRGFR